MSTALQFVHRKSHYHGRTTAVIEPPNKSGGMKQVWQDISSPLLTQSNCGCYHLRILDSAPVPTLRVYAHGGQPDQLVSLRTSTGERAAS